MSKKRTINAIAALTIFAGLSINAACESDGFALAGNVFGYLLLVGALFLIVDNKIKSMEA